MSEEKLLVFLLEEVFGRDVRNSASKKSRTREDGTAVVQTLGSEAVKQYVKGMIDLYALQKAQGINTNAHPRGRVLKATLKSRELHEAERRKTEYVDRGIGTLLDGYSEGELIEFVRYCWVGYETQGRVNPRTTEGFLRTVADFLFAHHTLVRGENRRAAELADLFCLTLANEGPTECPAMVMLMDNGKTNQHGQRQYNAVVRHKNFLLCTLSHTAFYFFYRWDICHQPPPRFQRRTQWYNKHILRGQTEEQGISYAAHLDWINKVYDGAGLHALKKTHAGRKEGSQTAEMAGVDETYIRRAGHWNSDAMTNCYLNSIARPFVRGMAGFEPNKTGNYFLPRAKVDPPETLVRAVWPWVDQWLAWVSSRSNADDVPYASLPPLDDSQSDQSDLAAQGFLRLLKTLRTILLQDSVLMRKEFPQHPMWTHEVFGRADYLTFAAELEASLAVPEPPEELRLKAVIPDVSRTIQNMHEDVVRTLAGSQGAVLPLLQLLLQRQDDAVRKLDELCSGQIPLVTVSRFDRSALTLPPRTDVVPAVPAGGLAAAVAPLPATTGPVVRMDAGPVSAPVAQMQAHPLQPTGGPAPSTQAPAGLPLDPDAPPPLYRMSRNITTVRDLWREWNEGLGADGPAVRELERVYGAKWRPDHAIRMFYSRRRLIIQEVERRIDGGASVDEAIAAVDFVRQADTSSKTLDKLAKLLQKPKPHGVHPPSISAIPSKRQHPSTGTGDRTEAAGT